MIQGDQTGQFFAYWGDCLCGGFHLKIAEVAKKNLGYLIFPRLKLCINFDTKWVWLHLLTNSSSHPVAESKC
jgi:hypothetical protein